MDPFNSPDPTNTPPTPESGEVSSTPVYNEQKFDDIFANVQNLPVARLRYEIEDFAEKHENTIVRADTSSGKSLALPPLYLEVRDRLGEADLGGVLVVEPRQETTRENATKIAKIYARIPKDGPPPNLSRGGDIGYQMRGDNKEGKQINVMTDGYLIEVIRRNPLLKEYWEIIFDERHEGNWHQDFGIALVKEVINPRRIEAGMKPIRISVVSATMNVLDEAEYLTGKRSHEAVFEIKVPRRYKINYEFLDNPLPKEVDYKDAVAAQIIKILDMNQGDIWAFLPGVGEIKYVTKQLQKILTEKGRLTEFDILPFHAQLVKREKEKVSRKRAEAEIKRIVLATNALETGIDPENEPSIVDSGKIKQNVIDRATGAKNLVTVDHCQSGLKQRAGRSGRDAEGFYYGVFTKKDFENRPEYPQHEIERMDLTEAVLDMKGMGVPDIYNFKLPKNPEREKLDLAVMELQNLKILDEHGELTEEGEFIYDTGLGPVRGRMIVEGMRNNCLDEMAKIAAVLGIAESPFIEGDRKADNYRMYMAHQKYNLLPGTQQAGEPINPSSDLFRYLQAMEAYEAHNRNPDWAKGEFLDIGTLEDAFAEYDEILGRLNEKGIPITGPRNFSNPQGDPILAQQTKAKAIAESAAPALVNNFMVADNKKEKYTGLVKTKGVFIIETISSVASGTHEFISSIGQKAPEGKIVDTRASIAQAIEPAWIPKYLPQLCTITNERITRNPVTGETIKTYNAVLNKPRIDFGTITEVVKPVKLPLSRRMRRDNPTATEWIPERRPANRATTIRPTATDPFNPTNTIRTPTTSNPANTVRQPTSAPRNPTPPTVRQPTAPANPTNTARRPATTAPNPTTNRPRPPRGPITPAERFKLEGETNESRREAAARMARSLAENAGFRPTPENRTILQKARNFWLKLQGKL